MVKPNERLGNYEVATAADGSAMILGSGAGGVTYRGRHIHLGTEVAIKVLIRRKNLLQKDRSAFLSEARAAASLTHPQIARILDFGESAQQHPYYVMELCEGGSLEEFGRKAGPPDEYSCIQWLFESASALAHAHQNGILHRDIKPSNLLVARQNEFASVKLIDFGLADHADQIESADHVIGTPHFAAPEQLRGRAEPASDVFSLGATFFWLITGNNLSHGDVKTVIAERLESVGYAALLTSLPPIWRTLIGRMLEIEPARRLRDGNDVLVFLQSVFPNHPGHPVAWDSAADLPGAGSNVAEPSQWVEFPDVAWSDRWTNPSAPISTGYGVILQASRPDATEAHDVYQFTNLSPEISQALTEQGDLVARYATRLGIGSVSLERGNNWWTVAWPALGSDDALSWVRQGQSASTAEILAALESIAQALDSMKSAGFEQMELHPSMLFVSRGASLKFSLVVPLPVLATADQAADSAGTMRGATGAELSARFAGCVYQLLSGRTPLPAAFVNARAYQAIPKLTERSNRFLSSAIAGTITAGTCQDVLRGLAHEERIPGASYSGGSGASRTASSWRSNPAISIPAPAIMEVLLQTQPAPIPASPCPPTIAVARQAKGGKLPIAAFAAVGTLVCGIVAWFVIPKVVQLTSRPTAPAPANVASESNEPVITPSFRTDDAAESKSVVTIPGDVSTISAAIKLCKPGGTIEIAGGTYSEAIVLTRSVSLVSKTAAVLEDSGLGSSLITARGPIKVTLRNIQIKNTQRQVDTALESSPSLVFIADGAEVHFEGCVIEGAVGNGVSLADKASATFSNCRIRKNRGYGINLTSRSKVAASLSEIQESGRSGIAAANVGSIVTLGSGATVTANSQNGVEIANGAELDCSGAEINGNQKVGLVVEGSGSQARLVSSCVISGNRKYGAGVTNSGRLEMSETTVEDNSENGIYVESGGQAKIFSSQFKSNGTIGVYLVSGATSSVTISKSKFESHSDAGVAFVEGSGKVSESHFTNNPMALFYGKGSSGNASENIIRPGPIENAVVTENAGEVSIQNNTIVGDE